MLTATAPASDPIDQLEQVIESALQRRLSEQGESFSCLLQGIQFRRAQRLLQDLGMPLTPIAKRLGYTDLANFIRAFKRWTGVGPNEYRRLHYEHGHK